MVTIIDYGVGNLMSIQNMLKKAGANSIISSRIEDVSSSDKIILPGMGHFDTCMRKFRESGLEDVVKELAFGGSKPVLGICVGLQMFMESSEEGTEKGLGWIDGKTVRFQPEQMDNGQKIPNMGWLDVDCQKNTPFWHGLENSRFYFAHSYHVAPTQVSDVLLTAQYGYQFCVGVQRNNIWGVQFHPEKSHRFGMQLLKNFAEL